MEIKNYGGKKWRLSTGNLGYVGPVVENYLTQELKKVK